MRISIELVPRDTDSLERDCCAILQNLPTVDTINVPDVLRFDLRSWQGCRCVQKYYPQTIPHIRAIDIDPKRPLPMGPFLVAQGITEVLVVTGDAPVDMSKKVYPTTSIDLIKEIKQQFPSLKVYAAVDPYRQGFRDEVDYVHRKMDAGADGLFTQPFFDLRMMKIYAELLRGYNVFWGVTPVASERSRSYWEARNRAVFPADFRPTLQWNRAFAGAALEFVQEQSASIYFMPIKVDILRYLQGIL